MSLLFLLAFSCRAEHTLQKEMQCSGSVLFDEDLPRRRYSHYLRYTSSTSSDITLVTIKMEVGSIMMTMNVTRVIDNLA